MWSKLPEDILSSLVSRLSSLVSRLSSKYSSQGISLAFFSSSRKFSALKSAMCIKMRFAMRLKATAFQTSVILAVNSTLPSPVTCGISIPAGVSDCSEFLLAAFSLGARMHSSSFASVCSKPSGVTAKKRCGFPITCRLSLFSSEASMKVVEPVLASECLGECLDDIGREHAERTPLFAGDFPCLLMQKNSQYGGFCSG